jgi:hypothetical protein
MEHIALCLTENFFSSIAEDKIRRVIYADDKYEVWNDLKVFDWNTWREEVSRELLA